MKNLVYTAVLFSLMALFTACEKNESISANTKSDYYYSLKGKTMVNMDVQFHQVENQEQGNCLGTFITCSNKDFDYLLEVDGGLPAEISSLEDIELRKFNIDIEFTGISYNCTNSYKKPSGYGDGSPVEIQQLKVTRIKILE
jgi:hypothetical protein